MFVLVSARHLRSMRIGGVNELNTDPDRGGHLLRGKNRERVGGRVRAEPVRQRARARGGRRRAAVVHDQVSWQRNVDDLSLGGVGRAGRGVLNVLSCVEPWRQTMLAMRSLQHVGYKASGGDEANIKHF